MLSVVTVELYDLCEVCLPCEHVLNTALIEGKSVCAQLKAMLWGETIMEI
jgi:hypothetical protein